MEKLFCSLPFQFASPVCPSSLSLQIAPPGRLDCSGPLWTFLGLSLVAPSRSGLGLSCFRSFRVSVQSPAGLHSASKEVPSRCARARWSAGLCILVTEPRDWTLDWICIRPWLSPAHPARPAGRARLLRRAIKAAHKRRSASPPDACYASLALVVRTRSRFLSKATHSCRKTVLPLAFSALPPRALLELRA